MEENQDIRLEVQNVRHVVRTSQPGEKGDDEQEVNDE